MSDASRKAFEEWKAAAIEDGMVAYWDCWQASRKQAREMIEAAWVAGYYHAGYTNDSAYAQEQAAKCADELLGVK